MKKIPKVSDHAVLRYLERKYNLNVKDIKQEMLSKEVRQIIKLGATNVSIDGVKYCIAENGTIKTIWVKK